MNQSPALIKEVSTCISKDFDLSAQELSDVLVMQELKIRLTKIISHLLDKDLNRLLSIFYRLDLDERKVATILSASAPGNVAEELAELTIERELKKAQTRLYYKNNP